VAKTVPLDIPTLAWARARFAEYYRTADIPVPPRLARREFAAFPFAAETSMRRHETLRTPEEFRRYLAQEVPRHVYYSTAYYRLPAEPTMARKEWLGADLIFDLDADHLRGAESLSYPEQLDRVKRRLIDLVDDFLLRDFGIEPTALQVGFSGGRGYHVHVRDERFLPLSSPERRELVDYVQGTGVDALAAVAPRHLTVRDDDGGGRGRRSVRLREFADEHDPGWRGRTTRAVLAVLARWEAGGVSTAVAELGTFGVPEKDAKQIAKALVAGGAVERLRTSHSLPEMSGRLEEAFLAAVVPRAAVEMQGETDAPVTTDVHRLIRLPLSLHGGTGLRVVPVAYDRIEEFEPLHEAPLADGHDGGTPVRFASTVDYPWADGRLRGTEGEERSVPTPGALFLLLRGEATFPP
jgi:DNA primase small subunit